MMQASDFSNRAQIAIEYFRIVMLSDYYAIWQEWQKRHPNQSWSVNHLWSMCFACCVSRYVSTEEAARVADYAEQHNYWINK